jgi:hypothetical protein
MKPPEQNSNSATLPSEPITLKTGPNALEEISETSSLFPFHPTPQVYQPPCSTALPRGQKSLKDFFKPIKMTWKTPSTPSTDNDEEFSTPSEN